MATNDDDPPLNSINGGKVHERRSGVRRRDLDRVRDLSMFDPAADTGNTAVLPPWEAGNGALILSRSFQIPRVTFRPRRGLAIIPVAMIVAGSVFLHRTVLGRFSPGETWMLGVWAVSLFFVLSQLLLAWFQRPYTVTEAQRAKLDRLAVAAVVPCYNEDPAILDRTIYALFAQTRAPDWVIVVDDGSTADYSDVRARWQAHLSATELSGYARRTRARSTRRPRPSARCPVPTSTPRWIRTPPSSSAPSRKASSPLPAVR